MHLCRGGQCTKYERGEGEPLLLACVFPVDETRELACAEMLQEDKRPPRAGRLLKRRIETQRHASAGDN